MKDSFIMYTDYMEGLEDLTRAQIGDFLLACMEYAKTDKVPKIEDKNVRIAFKMAKIKMDKDAQKWAETVEKRKEAGRKGGQASASKRKQSQANASKAKQSQANQADSVSECDCEGVNNNTNSAPSKAHIEKVFEKCWKIYPEKKGKGRVSASDKKRIALIGEDEMIRAIERYKDEVGGQQWKHWQNGSTFFHSGYVDYLDANFEKSKQKNKSQVGKFNNAMERDYNMDDLELKLLASN